MQKKPDRTVRCVYCGREFIEPIPHKCKGGYRKRNLKWINIMEEEKRKQFNAEEFISNEETPVETRDGKKVVILTTKRNHPDYPVVGDVLFGTRGYSPVLTTWNREGVSKLQGCVDNDNDDLFFSVKKKTHRMTYQELSWWLREHQEEHREFRYKGDISVFSTYTYRESSRNCPCEEGILIRSNGGEWKEPEIKIEEENDKRD